MDSALLNKVIEGLAHCTEDKCLDCPYATNDWKVKCFNNLMKDSLHLHTERIQGAGHLVDWDALHEI